MKKVFLILLVMILIAAGVLGYGFWGGMKTKAFAKEAGKIFTASQGKWSIDDIVNSKQEKDFSAIRTTFSKIQDDSNSAISAVNNLKSTKKTAGLKTDLISYYTLAKKSSNNAIILLDYMDTMNSITKNMSPTINASGMEQLAQQLSQFKTTVDKNLTTLKGLKTIPSIEKTNQDFIVGFAELSKVLGQALTALKSNNPEQVQTIMDSFAPTMEKMSNLKMPSNNEMKNDVLSLSKEKEIRSLETKIKDSISSFKNTVFTF